MEVHTFRLPEVSRELENTIEARLHVDRPSRWQEQILALQKRFTGVTTLPVYVIIDPVTERVLARRAGAASAEVFARFVHDATGGDGPGD